LSARTKDSENFADPPDVGCRAALESSAYVSVCRDYYEIKKKIELAKLLIRRM
jgi:hypothetical protein